MSKKRIVLWTFGALAGLLLLVVVAAVIIVRTDRFHAYVLSTIVRTAQQATGGTVEVGDYDIDWLGLRAQVHRFTLRGTEEDAARPLFSAERIGVSVRIISALGREVALNELELDHPVVNLWVAEDGSSNIPRPDRPEGSGRPDDIFGLAVRQVRISNGEISYNDQNLRLAAELRDLHAELSYEANAYAYEGTLAYAHGSVQLSDHTPLPHRLETTFRAAPEGVAIHHLALNAQQSQITFEGSVTDYADLAVQGAFTGRLSSQEIGNALGQSALPAGDVTISGTLRYENRAEIPFLQRLAVEAAFRSDSVALRLPQVTSDLGSVQGHVRLEEGNLTVDQLQSRLFRGQLDATFTMRDIGGAQNASVEASFRRISLSAASRSLAAQPLRQVPVDGSISGGLEARWQGSIDNLQLSLDAEIDAEAGQLAQAGAATTPLTGSIHLNYDAATGIISLRESFLRTAGTEVSFSGTASERSSLAVRIESGDLRELDLLVRDVRAALSQEQALSPPPLLGLSGAAVLDGRLQGTVDSPRFQGQLALDDALIRGTGIPALRVSIEASPSAVALRSGRLDLEPQGRIEFDVSTALDDWKFTDTSPVRLRASTRDLPLAELQRLAEVNYPVTGLLTADISAEGTRRQPAGRGSLTLTNGVFWEQPVQRLAVEFEAREDWIRSDVEAATPAGASSASLLFYPQGRRFEVQLDAPQLRLEEIEAVRSRELGVIGEISLTASGRGTLDAPLIEVLLEAPQLEVRSQVLSDLVARVNVADQRADVTLSSTVSDTELQATASVELTGDFYTEARVDAPSLPMEMLLARYMPRVTADFQGTTALHGSIRGPARDPRQMQAEIELPFLNMQYRALRIESVGPVRMRYQSGSVTLEQAQFTGTGTDLRLQGSIPVGEGRLDASARGTVDLRTLQIVNPAVDSSGQLLLDVRAQGALAQPDVQGRIRVVNAAMHWPGAPLGVDNLQGDLALRNNRLEIVRLEGQSGGGTISADGAVVRDDQTRFEVGLNARSVRLRYPQGVRSVLGSELRLSGTTESAMLRGQVIIERVSFTDEFDLANFADQFRSAPSPGPEEGFSANLGLDIAVQTSEALRLESAKLSLQGTSNLRLRGTLAQPVVVGRANLTGGEIFFLGNRYEIRNGVIDFTNPLRTEPVVSLAAATQINQYELNISFAGPLDRLRTTYISNPPLPPADIINLLAFGRTTAGGTGTPSLGAESLLAQGVANQLSGRLERLTGISHLSIDPGFGGNQQNPGARVVIQQRASSRLLFTFGIDLSATQSEVVQVEYQVSRGWWVRAVRDENGAVGVDVRRQRTF